MSVKALPAAAHDAAELDADVVLGLHWKPLWQAGDHVLPLAFHAFKGGSEEAAATLLLNHVTRNIFSEERHLPARRADSTGHRQPRYPAHARPSSSRRWSRSATNPRRGRRAQRRLRQAERRRGHGVATYPACSSSRTQAGSLRSPPGSATPAALCLASRPTRRKAASGRLSRSALPPASKKHSPQDWTCASRATASCMWRAPAPGEPRWRPHERPEFPAVSSSGQISAPTYRRAGSSAR